MFQIPTSPRLLTDAGFPWPDPLREGILAKGFSLPGRQLGTYPEFSYVGPTTKHAYGLIFPDIDVEFFLMGKTPDDAKMIYNTFLLWVDMIAGPGNRTLAGPENRLPTSDSTINPFLTQYYESYHTTARGVIFSPAGKEIVDIQFLETYPVAISPVQTSWESPDAPITFTVTFTYFYATTSL